MEWIKQFNDTNISISLLKEGDQQVDSIHFSSYKEVLIVVGSKHENDIQDDFVLDERKYLVVEITSLL